MVASVAVTIAFPLLFVAERPRVLLPLAVALPLVQVPLAWGLGAAFGLEGLALALAATTFAALAVLMAGLSRRTLALAAARARAARARRHRVAALSFGVPRSRRRRLPAAAVGLALYTVRCSAWRCRSGCATRGRYVRALTSRVAAVLRDAVKRLGRADGRTTRREEPRPRRPFSAILRDARSRTSNAGPQRGARASRTSRSSSRATSSTTGSRRCRSTRRRCSTAWRGTPAAGTLAEIGRFRGGSTVITAAAMTDARSCGRTTCGRRTTAGGAWRTRWRRARARARAGPPRRRRLALGRAASGAAASSLFVDGDHGYEGARADYQRWRAPGRARRQPALPRRRRHRRLRQRLSRDRTARRRDRAGRRGFERRPGAGSIAHFVASVRRLIAVVLNWNGGDDTLARARVARRRRDDRRRQRLDRRLRRARSSGAFRTSS